jgi:murein DD-endopeptidase MepM/ murein hydrolase activator NlpD
MSTIIWNRNIADEAHQKMIELRTAGHELVWLAFPPPGGNRWSLITDKTFFNRNIPDECHDKMGELRNAGHKLMCVAFPPGGGNSWSLITDKTFFNRNIPDECHDKMVELRNAGHKLLSVAFPPAGGNSWSVVTDKTFYNRNIPDECHDKMKEMKNAGHKLRQVAFPPQGGNRWSIVSDTSYYNRNVPSECHMILGEIYSLQGPVRCLAYDPDKNGWSVTAAGKPVVIYRLPFSDDGGWQLSNGNWDDPVNGHGENANGLQAFAFDFTHTEGGQIRAARGGTVYALVESESGNSWGSRDPCNPAVGNYLVIKHNDGTFGVYWHMKQNGIQVAMGQNVSRGDNIALSGNTGNSSTPHLHFDVRTGWDLAYSCSNLSEFPSIRIRFEDKNHICWIPRVGDTLASNNS